MSGTSGSGGVYGAASTPCDLIGIETTLASPNPKVKLEKGQVLSVQLSKEDVVVAVCVTKDKEIAGSLAFGEVRHLIGCMEEGHRYIATVVAIDGGRRTVHITHR